MKNATLLTFNRKVCTYLVARIESFKFKKRYATQDSFKNQDMYGRIK